MSGEVPTWTTYADIPRVVLLWPHLRKTLRIALLVGTILFCINQLDVVLRGLATPLVWVKIGVTFLVPFIVSNVGLLIGLKRDP